jgi:pilus assembly protein CpaB
MTRRIIGVFLAFLLAIVGTSAVYLYVQKLEHTVATGQAPIRVMIAKDRIPAGTSGARIRSQNLAVEVVMPKSSLPPDYLTELPVDLDKQVLTADVQADQLLLKGMFGQAGKFSGGLDIPDGLMAVTVAVLEPADVAQYVRPGSQVAVFGYSKIVDPEFKKETGEENNLTEVIVPRVTVLAVGSYGNNGQTASQAQDSAPLPGGNGTAGGNNNTLRSSNIAINVTLAVNQADATRLVHFSVAHDLYLALLTDTSKVEPGRPLTDRNAVIP